MQEVTLTRGVRLICGDQMLEFSQLRDMHMLVEQHNYVQWSQHFQNIQHWGTGGPLLNKKVRDTLDIRRSTFERFEELDRISRMYQRKTEALERREYIDLMTCMRQTQCKDPRDKLSSVISISHTNMLTIDVDYSLSAEEIYTNLARCTILKDQNLSILSCCSSIIGSVEVPSWTPDWIAPLSKDHAALPQHGIIKTCSWDLKREPIHKVPFYSMPSGSSLCVRFSENGRTLVLRGACIDEMGFSFQRLSRQQQ